MTARSRVAWHRRLAAVFLIVASWFTAGMPLSASPAAPPPRAEPVIATVGGIALRLEDQGRVGKPVSTALQIILMLTALALLPAIVIAMTSFTRTIIVLSMLRQAFGMQDTPPNMVLLSLALFLSLFTMAPAFTAAYDEGIKPFAEDRLSIDEAATRTLAPLRAFMIRQTRESDLQLILEIAKVPVPDSVEEVATVHLVPAFLISELKTAFQIGFVIFLPFLLLDLVVASILMAMGMIMVPPTIISLPLKVLMFVLIDGWALVLRALLGSFH
jgi:flagellar biosynthetic protein FliP